MAAGAWVMSDPKSWTLALRSGRLGRMLSRKRGMIGEVPLPVLKQWTNARDYAHQHFLARVHRRPPCSVAHESRKVCLGGRANRIRSLAPPPTPPYEDIKREYPTTSDSSAAELTELLIDRLVDYRAPVRQCSTHDLGTPVANALAERGVNTVVVPTGLDPSWTTGLSADVLTDGVSVVDQSKSPVTLLLGPEG